MNYSFDFDEELEKELLDDIEEFGENEIVYGLYKNIEGILFLVDYTFITDEELSDKELDGIDEYKNITLKDAYNKFKKQDSIFGQQKKD